ncbi:MAG: putative lipid II flippase FtsW [Gammaproteobacteria bacterium]
MEINQRLRRSEDFATDIKSHFSFPYDPIFIGAIFILLCWGLVMVASASIAMAERNFEQPFYYLQRQALFAVLGIVSAIVISRLSLEWWEKNARTFLLLGLLLLVIVLIPGIGHSVNGARRWLSLGLFSLQVSELIKLIAILYIASYMVRYAQQVRMQFIGFIKPMLVLGFVAALLLLEPDFGSVVIITSTGLAMLFLGGVKFRHFLLLICLVGLIFAVLVMIAPYRMQRLTSFMDPWSDQFNSGYQLTQALIAFGRGEWFGVGLGQSVQKLFYLPEAHTDFIFAVLSEELGLIGGCIFLTIFGVFLTRAFMIARTAARQQLWFAAYLAFGLTFWLALQALISIGVNAGILPTKGLTLPFISYGGSSLLVTLMAVGLLLRVQMEVALASTVRRKATPQEYTTSQ